MREDLIEQYIGAPGSGGSKVKLYSCNEHYKCLDPEIVNHSALQVQSLSLQH